MNVEPILLYTLMPELTTHEGHEIQKTWSCSEKQVNPSEYNAFEAYLIDLVYSETKTALQQRFGITIIGMLPKQKASDSTAYGYPHISKSKLEEHEGTYFLKVLVEVGIVEDASKITSRNISSATLTPAMQIQLMLYDKNGKKLKKANGKYRYANFLKTYMGSFMLWDENTTINTLRALPEERATVIDNLIKQSLGKLQEDFYN